MTPEQKKEYEKIFANNFNTLTIGHIECFKEDFKSLYEVIILSMHEASNKVKSRSVSNLKIDK